MILLIAGLLIWIAVHFIPVGAPDLRKSIVGSLKLGPYKGLFSLLLIASIFMMVTGWQQIEPIDLFQIPNGLQHAAMALMFPAIYLFVAARHPSRIKQFIRHPQLAAVKLWGLLHVLMNGDHRAIVLFMGLVIWAVLMVIFSNRRDGAYEKPAVPSWAIELRCACIAALIYGVLIYTHVYFTGAAII